MSKLFKLPSVPASAINKRKWTAPPPGPNAQGSVVDIDHDKHEASATQHAKRARVTTVDEDLEIEREGSSGGGDDGDGEYATVDVQDVPDDEDEEGGRFFGGGLNAKQQQILDILHRDTEHNVADDTQHAEDDAAHARRLFVQLEKAINKNEEMRLKHADNPRRFIDSEVDLDAAIRELVVLTTNVAVMYPAFVKHGMATSLVGLLTHENVDIAAAAMEVIAELVDEDVVSLEGSTDEMHAQARNAREAMMHALAEHDVTDLLLSNLTRLNDAPPSQENADLRQMEHYESDAKAVYYILSILESLKTSHINTEVLFPWLLKRILRPERVDQNQAYAAELLVLCLVDDEKQRQVLAKYGGVDALLRAMSKYLHRPLHDADEIEYFQNLVDAMGFLLLDVVNRATFLECEGVELMLLLLKRKRRVRTGALTLLWAVTQNGGGASACERLVDAGGLKALGALLMRPIQQSASDASGMGSLDNGSLAAILGILEAMLYNLPSESEARVRLLSKLMEQEYGKIDQVLALRESARRPLAAMAPEFERLRREYAAMPGAREEDVQEAIYADKIDSGYWHVLERANYVLAWLMMEDDDAQAHIRRRLGNTWTQIIDELDESFTHYDNEHELRGAGGETIAEITHALTEYLRSLV